MPARDEEQEIGRRRPSVRPRGQRVRLEVIDGDEGLARAQREGLRRGDADQQPADQARPGVTATRVDVVEVHAGLVQGLRDDPSRHSTCARAAISGTTPPKSAWLLALRSHDVGENDDPGRAYPRRPGGGRSSQLVSMPSTTRSRGFGAVAMMLLYRVRPVRLKSMMLLLSI